MAATEDSKRDKPLTEWMKIMLDEIERKESEQQEAQEELRRRGRSGDNAAGKDDASTDAHD